MLEELVPKYREEFANFDIFADRFDDFIIPILSAKKLDILSKVYILIFCLSHGQSAVERGFSANKEYIKENQSENCFVSLRIIHNHLRSKKVTASSITIITDMNKSVRSVQQGTRRCLINGAGVKINRGMEIFVKLSKRWGSK